MSETQQLQMQNVVLSGKIVHLLLGLLREKCFNLRTGALL